ncbi:MAG: NAD(P)-dependent glycerol-3-phosphate dehydrogenase [Clostridiales bacterium]|nr:NAD(P)-dependent glycerol-3-phosphate dehydrogenase [Clostridiales bacterium]
MQHINHPCIGVLGAGTWGVALARLLKNNGCQVTVWSALADEIRILKTTGKHPKLPDMSLPEGLCYTADMETACRDKDILVMAVPSVFVRKTAHDMRPFLRDGQIVVDVAKGIEESTLLTMSGIIEDELSGLDVKVVALSGPTHAEEVAQDLPTAIVSACEDESVAQYVQQVFSNNFLRVYTNTDKKGVEICGALKNVIALATGISAGLGYGDNAKAALITRGVAEIARLGSAAGCTSATFSGLTGLGDLVVTCTSRHSRNNRAGFLMGQGLSPEEAIREVGMVVEGVNTLPAAVKMAERYQVELPIIETVNLIVRGGMRPCDAVNALLSREMKSEIPVSFL